eukprot:14174987-Alexandrium_andersonii.AAC.1
MASTLVPEARKGCILRRFPRTCRICRRSLPTGAPEALLGGSLGRRQGGPLFGYRSNRIDRQS